jgi:uncharacterized protein
MDQPLTGGRCETLDLQSLPAVAWRNGAGLTRELAVQPRDASADFDWRLSVAEVERDAPFSAFPGIDRCIVLLRGAGMRLHSAAGRLDERLDRAHRPFHFSGDDALNATLVDGPCRDFNVMVRRGRWRADVRALHGPTRTEPAAAGLVLASLGRWSDGARGLGPLQAWLWRDGMPALDLECTGDAPCALLVQLEPAA